MYNIIIITIYINIVIDIIRVFTLLSFILRKPIVKSTKTAITAFDDLSTVSRNLVVGNVLCTEVVRERVRRVYAQN